MILIFWVSRGVVDGGIDRLDGICFYFSFDYFILSCVFFGGRINVKGCI